MLDTSNITREPIIAGSKSGKPVRITPSAKPVYDELLKLARRGNHWARISVKSINDLAAGRLHQNNIFIRPSAVSRGGREEFVVVLPGCKVTVEKLAEDGFKILFFEADVNYFELQKQGLKPALYSGEKDPNSNRWDAELRKDGLITDMRNRLVAVSDGASKDPKSAVQRAAPRVSKAPFSGGSHRVNADGFELHFTPGKSRLGGLVNYRDAIKPLNNSNIHESAILLAKTMYDARDMEGVGWIAEFGGSAVLTQAMKILVDRGITLKGHTAFLFRPRTSPSEAVQLAHQLKLTLDRDFTSTGAFDYIGNRDQIEVIGHRLKTEKGYTLLKASADVAKLGTKAQGAAALLAAAGIGMTAPAMPAILTFLGALVGTAATGTAISNSALEQLAPDLHDTIKGKF